MTLRVNEIARQRLFDVSCQSLFSPDLQFNCLDDARISGKVNSKRSWFPVIFGEHQWIRVKLDGEIERVIGRDLDDGFTLTSWIP